MWAGGPGGGIESSPWWFSRCRKEGIQAEEMRCVCRELGVPGGRGSECSSEKLSGEELEDLGVSWGVCEGF